MITFEELKKTSLNYAHLEPEISIEFSDKESQYMIIVYEDRVTFQRCGANDGSGEIPFHTLDELYETETVDGILLKRDWNKITDIYSFELEMSGVDF